MDIITDEGKLWSKCREVKEGEKVDKCVDALLEAMKETEAWSLAANQLGFRMRIIVMKFNAQPAICILNPVIVKPRGSQTPFERCLSFPKVAGIRVKRPHQVSVKGVNRYFKPVKYKLRGLQAASACHEIDHLNGVLIIDHYKKKATGMKEASCESCPSASWKGV